SYFTYADREQWGKVGAVVMKPHREYYGQMSGEALKIPHGHFQHFAPAQPGDDFPWAQFLAYEAAERAAGRPPLRITATYQGKVRPVYFAWHLGLDSQNRP